MYDPNKAKDVESGLPSGISAEGVILGVKDGKSKDFVHESSRDKWKGDLESPAIETTIMVKHEGKDYTFNKMFTYQLGADGETEVNIKSNLGKYKKFYNKLPEANDKVKCTTNAEGFWRMLIE